MTKTLMINYLYAADPDESLMKENNLILYLTPTIKDGMEKSCLTIPPFHKRLEQSSHHISAWLRGWCQRAYTYYIYKGLSLHNVNITMQHSRLTECITGFIPSR